MKDLRVGGHLDETLNRIRIQMESFESHELLIDMMH